MSDGGSYADSRIKGGVREAIGESEAFLYFQEQLSLAAKVDRPILIIGERGTGKELAAARLHYLSPRWREPLMALNCAALSPNLIESELFGYEAGAFTGAVGRRKGRFESADGGTLFLDEIGAIPREVQAKILRTVEYQTFERVGGSSSIQVDVRIIGATNADLPAMAEKGDFQRDLLDRLSFEVLHAPPLRDRSGDIPLLSAHFAAKMAHELGRTGIPEFTIQAMERLESYPWPGNVRELKNVVERAVYKSETNVVSDIVFNPFPVNLYKYGTVESGFRKDAPSSEKSDGVEYEEISFDIPFHKQAADFELKFIEAALKKAKYNQKTAAELMGLTYNQFRGLYKKYKDLMLE